MFVSTVTAVTSKVYLTLEIQLHVKCMILSYDLGHLAAAETPRPVKKNVKEQNSY